MNGAIPIAYVIDKLQLAGAQVHLEHLLRGLDRGEFRPQVFCLIRGGPIADRLRALGTSVEVLGMETIYGPRALWALPRLVRALRGTPVVHTYLVSANLYGTLAARLARARAVITSRRDTGFSRNWRLRLVEQWLVNPRVDRVVAVCPAVARQVERERGLSPERVVTIPNGVDAAAFDPVLHPRVPARRRLGLAADEAALGVIGHLSPVKGHADLLVAMVRIAARRPRTRLIVVGDGVLRQPLERQASALGLADRVVFAGATETVAEVLAALDVVVVPSHTEGLSNALLEAMAMARPVVATAVGGNPDVVEADRSGRLVPPRNPERLAEAVLRLLECPGEAQLLGEAARRRVLAGFTLARMVAGHAALYRSLARA
ncbi:MAG TPA: glycosyltransferase [Vicinamibacteria bacterium]|nr:glycosyltransferase [Vicinamibacteria bacterium]